jgi:hypothetical protein
MSASNVPGNGYLYEDDAVPLYNYVNDATANAVYGSVQKEAVTLPWRYTYVQDALCPESSATSPEFTTFATVNVLNVSILDSYYVFSVSIPFTLYVQCDVSSSTITSPIPYVDDNAVKIWLSDVAGVTFGLFYSDQQCTIPAVTIDVSMNGYDTSSNALAIDASMVIYPASNPLHTENRFYAYNYMGVINIGNIVMQTQPGYIYDMGLAVNFNNKLSDNYTTYFANPKIAVYLNSQFSTTQIQPYNCSVKNPTSITASTMPVFAIGSHN